MNVEPYLPGGLRCCCCGVLGAIAGQVGLASAAGETAAPCTSARCRLPAPRQTEGANAQRQVHRRGSASRLSDHAATSPGPKSQPGR